MDKFLDRAGALEMIDSVPKRGDKYVVVKCPICNEKTGFLYDNSDVIVCNRKSNCGAQTRLWEYAKGNGFEYKSGRYTGKNGSNGNGNGAKPKVAAAAATAAATAATEPVAKNHANCKRAYTQNPAFHYAGGFAKYRNPAYDGHNAKFFAVHKHDDGFWYDGKGDWSPVPYNLDLLKKETGLPVLVLEGEKDCDTAALESLKYVPTTNHDGAGNWPKELTQYYKDRDVIICMDVDAAGENGIVLRFRALYAVAASVRIIDLRPIADKAGFDFTDAIEGGFGFERIIGMAKSFEQINAEEGELRKKFAKDQRVFLYRRHALPREAVIPDSEAKEGCNWLDTYIAFSKRASPLGYDQYHQSVGIWLLSVINARRSLLRLSVKEVYGNLFTILVGRSSVYSKSETMQVALQVLRHTGFGRVVLDSITPEALINALANQKVPKMYHKMNDTARAKFQEDAGWARAKALVYDEFGGQLESMVSPMSAGSESWRDLFRRIENPSKSIKKRTLSRGEEIVDHHYVSVLANITTKEIAKIASRGHTIWGDGSLARFGFSVALGVRDICKEDIFNEPIDIPDSLCFPLNRMHERLGKPVTTIKDIYDTDGYVVDYSMDIQYPVTQCSISKEAYHAYQSYEVALRNLAIHHCAEDFAPNYTRLPHRALKMALLFASLGNDCKIEMPHWAKAQEIAEQERQALHNLQQLYDDYRGDTGMDTIDGKVLEAVSKKYADLMNLQAGDGDEKEARPSRRNLQRAAHCTAGELTPVLERLVKAGLLVEIGADRNSFFKITSPIIHRGTA